MRRAALEIDRMIRRAVLFGGLAAALAACAPQPSAVSPAPSAGVAPQAAASPRVDLSRPVRVALLAPRSAVNSEDQAAAADVEAAARLAAGEAGGPAVDLRVYDTAGRGPTAASAMRRAVSEGAQVVIGPFFRDTTNAVRPVAEETGAPVLSFSSDSAAGDPPVWVLGDLPEASVERIVGYAAGRGAGAIALVRPETEYGRLVETALREAAPRVGARVVETVPYVRSAQGVEAAAESGAQRILASGANAALIADGGLALRTVASFLAFHDVLQPQVRYLGTALWATPDIAAEAPLRGGWFAAPDPQRLAAFEARFREATGRDPHPLAAFGYDAMRAVSTFAARARSAGSDRPFTAEAIAAVPRIDGARGAFRLTPGGENRRALAVLEVTEGGFALLDPAPGVLAGGS